jgi:hypothetical protein
MNGSARFRRLSVGCGLIAAIVGAAWSWRALQANRSAEAANEALARERANIEAANREFETKIADVGRRRSEAEVAEQKQARGVPVPRPSSHRAEARPRPMANDPGQQARALQRFRVGLFFENFPFYRAAHLDEKQIQRLEEILTEHQGRGRDLQFTAQERGLAANDPAIAALRREETERFESELGALLGDDGRRRFGEFQAGAADRRSIAEVVGNFALTPTPLAPLQARQLEGAFKDLRFRSRRTEPAMWDELLQRSQAFLSPAQIAELQGMAADARRENAMNDLAKLARSAVK